MNSIMQPWVEGESGQLELTLRELPHTAHGKFRLLMVFISLTATTKQLKSGAPDRDLASLLESRVLENMQRLTSVRADALRPALADLQEEIGSSLVRPSEDDLMDIGLWLATCAMPDVERFKNELVFECGKTAAQYWKQASFRAAKLLGLLPELDASKAKIDQQVYLMNYKEHYGEVLSGHLNKRRLAELFLFRGWTAQFGFRIFTRNEVATEVLIGEAVNSILHLGGPVFRMTHGFAVETELEASLIDLIEDRWKEYDLIVALNPDIEKIPVRELVTAVERRMVVADPIVHLRLSMDFMEQLNFIKRTAIDLGLL